MTLACNQPTESGVEAMGSWGGKHGNHSPSVRGRVQLVTETLSLSSVLDARDGATWLGSAKLQCQL